MANLKSVRWRPKKIYLKVKNTVMQRDLPSTRSGNTDPSPEVKLGLRAVSIVSIFFEFTDFNGWKRIPKDASIRRDKPDPSPKVKLSLRAVSIVSNFLGFDYFYVELPHFTAAAIYANLFSSKGGRLVLEPTFPQGKCSVFTSFLFSTNGVEVWK